MIQKTINHLNTGDKITVIYISAMAATWKYEYVVSSLHSLPGNLIQLLVTEKGKRKKVIYTPKPEHIVLPGHDLPLKCDTEFNTFRGNAQLNLVAESKEIALDALTKSLIPITDYHKSRILFFTPAQMNNDDEGEGVKLYKMEGK